MDKTSEIIGKVSLAISLLQIIDDDLLRPFPSLAPYAGVAQEEMISLYQKLLKEVSDDTTK